jgi:hypothetical protein
MEKLKIKVLSKINITSDERNTRFNTIDKSATCQKSRLLRLRNKLSATMNFVSRATWFEFGEKSNKFFLNLIKTRQNQKLMHRIISGDKTFEGQDQVSKGITEFYNELYSSKPTKPTGKDYFYKNCPKLSEDPKKVFRPRLESKRSVRSTFNLQRFFTWTRRNPLRNI